MKGIIGQEKVVNALLKAAEKIRAGCPMPSFGFYDGPGLGKTFILLMWIRFLATLGIRGIILDFTSRMNVTATVYKQAMIDINDALANGERCMLFVDEIGNKGSEGSAIKNCLSLLRGIGSGEGSQIVPYGFSEPVTFSSRILGVVIASYNTGRMQADLIGPAGRFAQTEDFRLGAYSPSELSDILKLDVGKEATLSDRDFPRMTDAGLMLIARSMRGNARQSGKIIAPSIVGESALNPEWRLTLESAAALCKEKGIAPHGLSAVERRMLSHLSVKSLKKDELAGKAGIGSKEAWQEAKNYLEIGPREGLLPFQLSNRDGEEIAGAYGSLIDQVGSTYVLTGHGARMVAILRKGGWIL